MARIWVSPTEPRWLTDMADVVSMHSEDYGADVLVHGITQSIAIQRKEVGDLISSAGDGRLAEQVVKLKRADTAIIILEGPLNWTTDGYLLTSGWGEKFTKVRFQRMVLSLAHAGVPLMFAADAAETAAWVTTACRWADATEHTTLAPKGARVSNDWGERRVEHYQLAVLSSLPGLGIELARRILNDIGFPFTLNEKLKDVKGIGKKKYDTIRKITDERPE